MRGAIREEEERGRGEAYGYNSRDSHRGCQVLVIPVVTTINDLICKGEVLCCVFS